MANIIWTGTAYAYLGDDGIDKLPMRVTEDSDGRLMTEWDEGNGWYPDYLKCFYEMRPAPSEELVDRMIKEKLLDAR